MISEQLHRNQLMKVWRSKLEELRSQGEDATHIQRFLSQVERLPGQTVGDLCDYWTRQRCELRPVWNLLFLALCLLAGVLSSVCVGVAFAFCIVGLIGCLGFYYLQMLRYSDEAFSRELLARADCLRS